MKQRSSVVQFLVDGAHFFILRKNEGYSMRLFDKVFNNKKKRHVELSQVVNESSGSFGVMSEDPYDNDIFREGVDSIARLAGKLRGSHVVLAGDRRTPATGSDLNQLLRIRPNPYMSAYDFLYKMATHFYLKNNAFALIDRDNGAIRGFFPITYTQMQFLMAPDGTLYCKFFTRNGGQYTFLYSDLIHIRRHFNSNDLLGDNNGAIRAGLELSYTQNKGIVAGIKSGASIRGILKIAQLLNDEDIEKEKEKFKSDYLGVDNTGGIIVSDSKADFTPIENKPQIISADQLQETRKKIFDYLGISENIVRSSYTEDEFAAFYESVLEPFAVQLSLEFTAKVFTLIEQKYGNMIQFDGGRLNFTSNKTKIEAIKELVPYGLLSVNDCLEMLNLPLLPEDEGGSKRLQTLNVVDINKANVYQVGEGSEQDE